MHTTALCSPSRACIVTGRNHHSNAMACITEAATGYPGLQRRHPVRERLPVGDAAQHGYNTYMVGKYHLTPSRQETPAGPYDRWPLGRGFQRYYGFLGGDTSQWYPDLVYDNHQVEPPKTPAEGYHLSEDLADKAIDFIADAKQVDPGKPFYLHFCPGATHARTMSRRSGPTATRGSSTTAGTPTGRRCSPGRRSPGIVPPDAELSRHDPDVPEWDTLSAPSAGCTAG